MRWLSKRANFTRQGIPDRRSSIGNRALSQSCRRTQELSNQSLSTDLKTATVMSSRQVAVAFGSDSTAIVMLTLLFGSDSKAIVMLTLSV